MIAGTSSSDKSVTENPVASVNSKWDEILEGLGIAKGAIRPGLWLSDQTIVSHLQSEGATTQIVDLITYRSSPLSIRMMAERHKQRMYSRDWELPENIHTEAVKILNFWLSNECPEPDKEVSQQMVFRAISARWEE